jgi:hypothetical protein
LAILHHLDIAKAYEQISNILKATGKAIFLEPLGHNPIINFYRFMTPGMRTPDEHPLLRRDLKLAKKFFRTVKTEYFQLLTLLSIPLVRTRYFVKFLTALEKLEIYLFKYISFSRLMAWSVIIQYKK